MPAGAGRGGGRLTKDICGMSFLGEGLQLVVTPAVLSVAVPGVLHHLKEQITTWRVSVRVSVRACELWLPKMKAQVWNTNARMQQNGNVANRPLVSTKPKSISADTEQLGNPLITQPSASHFARVIIWHETSINL